MKIIGFCGLPGSGKSKALDAIKEMGYIVNMGDIIRNEAEKRNLDPTDLELGKIARELREKEGLGVIAQKSIELINDLDQEIIFIDGLRSMEEILVFRKYWKFPVIAIIIDEKRRYELIKERARRDDPKSYNELRLRDNRETSFGLKKVIENADYFVTNNTSIMDLEKQVKKLVNSIIKQY